jgi:viroplasmin and RNaseH domain-containing protein
MVKIRSDCKEQVNGYSGSKYKSFNTAEEAQQYINSSNNVSVFRDLKVVKLVGNRDLKSRKSEFKKLYFNHNIIKYNCFLSGVLNIINPTF